MCVDPSRSRSWLLACGVLLASAAGCDETKEGGDAKAAAGGEAPADEGKPAADEGKSPAGDGAAAKGEAEPEPKARTKKDRGEASMKIGDVAWTADSAKATSKAPRLTIRATRTDIEDGKVSRQELHLQIDAYEGPGEYETGISGSRFIGVGLDTDAAKAAEGDDAKTTKVATDALTQAKHLMLSKAKVKIDSESETELVGTFSWAPPPGLKSPALSEGKFRAVLEKK